MTNDRLAGYWRRMNIIEEDYCYRKIADIGDDDQDWKQVGLLIEALGLDSLSPYT